MGYPQQRRARRGHRASIPHRRGGRPRYAAGARQRGRARRAHRARPRAAVHASRCGTSGSTPSCCSWAMPARPKPGGRAGASGLEWTNYARLESVAARRCGLVVLTRPVRGRRSGGQPRARCARSRHLGGVTVEPAARRSAACACATSVLAHWSKMPAYVAGHDAVERGGGCRGCRGGRASCCSGSTSSTPKVADIDYFYRSRLPGEAGRRRRRCAHASRAAAQCAAGAARHLLRLKAGTSRCRGIHWVGSPAPRRRRVRDRLSTHPRAVPRSPGAGARQVSAGPSGPQGHAPLPVALRVEFRPHDGAGPRREDARRAARLRPRAGHERSAAVVGGRHRRGHRRPVLPWGAARHLAPSRAAPRRRRLAGPRLPREGRHRTRGVRAAARWPGRLDGMGHAHGLCLRHGPRGGPGWPARRGDAHGGRLRPAPRVDQLRVRHAAVRADAGL